MWSIYLAVTFTTIWKGTLEWIWDSIRLLESKEITSLLREDSVETDKKFSYQEQLERSIKTSIGFSSFSTGREEQDKDFFRATISVQG